MPSGIESWSNPGEIGAMYPFAGTEVAMTIVAVVLWIAWHVVTAREENQQWDELDAAYGPEPPVV